MKESSLARIRALVLAHGWNATSYQIVNPGIRHWFSPTKEAVVGYVETRRFRIVAGSPICSAESLPYVCQEFEQLASQDKKRVCYFGGESRIERIFEHRPDHAHVILGAQPAWNPANWEAIIKRHSSLRAQLNRARNKSVRTEEWSAERANDNASLKQCLKEWLSTRGLPPLHFLVEPQTLSLLKDRRIFVALRNELPVAFLVASPIPCRNGWLIEQFVRGKDAPNGTNELLIDHAMRQFAAERFEYVTLGLSPLSKRAVIPEEFKNPLWLQFLLAWTRAHGTRFYNFEGLDAFKAKLQPDWWEPIYAITNESQFSIATLYAIAGAFTDGKPIRHVLSALMQAIGKEATRFNKKIDALFFRPTSVKQ